MDYDSKWCTKFHNDCMLENVLISLLRRLLKKKNYCNINMGLHIMINQLIMTMSQAWPLMTPNKDRCHPYVQFHLF